MVHKESKLAIGWAVHLLNNPHSVKQAVIRRLSSTLTQLPMLLSILQPSLQNAPTGHWWLLCYGVKSHFQFVLRKAHIWSINHGQMPVIVREWMLLLKLSLLFFYTDMIWTSNCLLNSHGFLLIYLYCQFDRKMLLVIGSDNFRDPWLAKVLRISALSVLTTSETSIAHSTDLENIKEEGMRMMWEPKDGVEWCEILSSRCGMATALLNSQYLWLLLKTSKNQGPSIFY